MTCNTRNTLVQQYSSAVSVVRSPTVTMQRATHALGTVAMRHTIHTRFAVEDTTSFEAVEFEAPASWTKRLGAKEPI
jgi:hypothetical protein